VSQTAKQSSSSVGATRPTFVSQQVTKGGIEAIALPHRLSQHVSSQTAQSDSLHSKLSNKQGLATADLGVKNNSGSSGGETRGTSSSITNRSLSKARQFGREITQLFSRGKTNR